MFRSLSRSISDGCWTDATSPDPWPAPRRPGTPHSRNMRAGDYHRARGPFCRWYSLWRVLPPPHRPNTARWTWSFHVPVPLRSISSVSTGRLLNVAKVSGVMKSCAPGVITTCTSQPAFTSSRTNCADLYAAMPPVTPKSTFRFRRVCTAYGSSIPWIGPEWVRQPPRHHGASTACLPGAPAPLGRRALASARNACSLRSALGSHTPPRGSHR